MLSTSKQYERERKKKNSLSVIFQVTYTVRLITQRQPSKGVLKKRIAGVFSVLREVSAQILSCEFCDIFKSTFFDRTPTLREKCPNTEFFLVCISPHSDWIRRDTKYLSVFSPNVGKYGPEETPYLDTFQTVLRLVLLKYFDNVFEYRCYFKEGPATDWTH